MVFMLVRISAGVEGGAVVVVGRGTGRAGMAPQQQRAQPLHSVTWGLSLKIPPQCRMTDNPFSLGFLGGFQSRWVF